MSTWVRNPPSPIPFLFECGSIATTYGRSSIGRAADSKSAGWGFNSLRPCIVAPEVHRGHFSVEAFHSAIFLSVYFSLDMNIASSQHLTLSATSY